MKRLAILALLPVFLIACGPADEGSQQAAETPRSPASSST